MRRPLMVAAAVVIATVGVLSGGAVSRGKPDPCVRNPGKPKCRTVTATTVPSTTTATTTSTHPPPSTTAPPPTTTTQPPPSTGEVRANLWVVP
jgi:hypothetical protein